MSQRRGARRIAAFAMMGAGIALIGIAAASGLIFTQTFPSVPNAPPGSITASCSDLQYWGIVGIPAGGGSVLFNCTGMTGAFVVTDAPVTVTPSFALPANATDLYVLPWDSNYTSTYSCSIFEGSIALTSGVSVTIGTSGYWDYCIDATGALQGFSISWSQ